MREMDFKTLVSQMATALLALSLIAPIAAQTRESETKCPAPNRASSRNTPAVAKIRGEFLQNDVLIQDIFLEVSATEQVRAFIIKPNHAAPQGGAVFFLHWLGGPPANDRSEFFEDAVQLAERNVTSLLVDAPWADPEWFPSRKLEEDPEATLRFVSTLEAELDFLISEAKAAPDKVAFVGHDFGAMYGALLIARSPSIHHAVVMAAVPDFADWFLLGRKLPQAEEAAYRTTMAPFAPARHLACSGNVDVLFQFAQSDKFVNHEQADAFVAGSPVEKQVRWYPGGHALQHESQSDRIAWLNTRVGSKAPK